ncbi:MAG: hypothetical protein SGPRY_010495, partial [Prymnesium sp.]
TEYWVSQERHWCEYCRIFINGTKASIAFHENGKKHKEIVELFLRDMRKRGRERRVERDETAREIARIEREAAKQHQREDKMGMAGQGVAAPLSEARAERMAQLEASMAEAKQQREEARALSALPHGWSEAVNPDGKSFYTHLASGAVQWERPVASEAGVGGWEQGWTETGVPYYFNLQKGVTQWEARHLSNLSSQPLRAFVPLEWSAAAVREAREMEGGSEAAEEGRAAGMEEGHAAGIEEGQEGCEPCSVASRRGDDASLLDPNTGLGTWQVVETPPPSQ